ncbi:MAG: DNA-binding protein, partial [Oxalobacter formigenes]|nr:DNA-binding protein [Oxalobacter formigenes]
SYTTLKNRKRESDLFASAIKRGKAKANVFVGGKLMEQIKNGNTVATIFYMKSRCGWKEKNITEHSGIDGGPIEVKNIPTLNDEQLHAIAAGGGAGAAEP